MSLNLSTEANMILASVTHKPCLQLRARPKRPRPRRDQQKALAMLYLSLEETEEKIEILQALHAKLEAKIATIQQQAQVGVCTRGPGH